MPNAVGIYVIRNTVTGDFYIGSSSQIGRRIGCHRSQLKAGRHSNQRLQNAWHVHGSSAFIFEPICYTGVPEMRDVEQRLLDRLAGRQDCYNISPLVSGFQPWTPEQRARQGARLRGRKKPPMSMEQRAKISAAHKRFLSDPATRDRTVARLRVPRTPDSYRRSPETAARIGDANRGRTPWNAGRAHPPETIAKITEKARSRGPEWRQRVSASKAGKTLSAEARANMSAQRKGKPRTKAQTEHTARMQSLAIGRRHTDEAKAKMRAKAQAQTVSRRPNGTFAPSGQRE